MKPIVFALIAPLLTTAGLFAHAADDAAWRVFAQSDEEEWSGQPESLRVSAPDLGAKTIRINGRMLSKKTRHVDPVYWSVTAEACNADSGQLVTSDLSGNYVVPFDFVKGANTFESITAQAICSAYFNANK